MQTPSIKTISDEKKNRNAEPMETSIFPGIGNSIRARVRYFDDIVDTIRNSMVQKEKPLNGIAAFVSAEAS